MVRGVSSQFLMFGGILAIVCVSFFPSGAQTIDSQVREHFMAAVRYQQQGQLDPAISEYKAVLHLRPGLPEAYVNLGLIYYAQANYSESARALAEAQKLKPHMRGVSLWLGIDDVKLNQPARAVPLLREATVLNPADKQAQTWLGTALWDAGDKTAAIEQLTRAKALFPADVNIYFVLGEAYRKAANDDVASILAQSAGKPLLNQIYGDIYREQLLWPKAIAHYQLAIQRDPQWRGARLGIGEIDLAEHRPAEAQKEFSSELSGDPSSAQAYALLGETALFAGNVPQAVQMLRHAIAISPYAASAALGVPAAPAAPVVPPSAPEEQVLRKAAVSLQYLPKSSSRSLALAFVDEKLGSSDFDRSWAAFQQTAAEPPEPADPLRRAKLEYDRGAYGRSAAIVRSWLGTHPHDLQAQYLLAKTYSQLSLQVLGQLIRLDPDSYRSHELLAETYENREDDDKALAEYRIVEQMDPSLPGIHFEIGRLLGKESHPAEALKELHKELELDPDYSEANGEIGTILAAQHEPAQAIPYLRTALRINPELWQVHEQLGKAYMQEREYPQAESEFLKALNHDPDGDAHYQLALVYRAEGRGDAAAREFEEVRKIKEDHPDPAVSKWQQADAQ